MRKQNHNYAVNTASFKEELYRDIEPLELTVAVEADDTQLEEIDFAGGCLGSAGTLGCFGTGTGCLGTAGTAGTYGCGGTALH